MSTYQGDFDEDATVLLDFNTFDSNDPSASVTITNLVDADIKVHKDGNATPIVTDGATIAIDFATVTGQHLITIDTSVDAAYSTGSDYNVRIEGTTVDGATINAWIGSFSVENRHSATANAAIQATVDAIPTTAMRGTDNALLAVSINLTGGAVDTVTSLTNKTGFSLAATGLDLITSTATGAVQLAKAVWDRIVSKANHDIGQSAGKILRQSGDLVQIDGAVSDVSPATTGFDTNLTQADGYFDDAVMIFSNGSANAGIGKPVSTYLNASGAVTFLAPDDWPVTPVNGDDFVIFANHVHPVAQIADAVTDEPLAGHTTAGTLGKAISDTEVAAVTSLPALLPAALVGGRMDANVGAISTSATAADNLEESALGIVTGAVEGSPTTTNIPSGLTEATVDHYKGRILTFITGAVAGQSTDITAYAADGAMTVTALTNAPSATDTFVIT